MAGNGISQSNTYFEDNPQTKYLLIIGNNDNNRLNWKYFEFDSRGQKRVKDI